MTDTKREILTRLYDKAQPEGAAYLLVIVTLGSASMQELIDLTGDSAKTVSKRLTRLESRGLVQRARNSEADRWFPTQAIIELWSSWYAQRD